MVGGVVLDKGVTNCLIRMKRVVGGVMLDKGVI